ncbi:Helix-turn-helix domain-containing protein [Parafrankia irregularis]|uniref:Helix-turn-helix domain-containing protein n=1 Tax=Parafrankia irregularis TaxID=795642 RepID=A0A0S4QS67_9ACTN|nr:MULTISPECIES: helix-turn-helix transcriptional regulator [Parafrankia]CUU58339.1 Helix-turn-helix domain-containing protein [Parafrankia irregularis]
MTTTDGPVAGAREAVTPPLRDLYGEALRRLRREQGRTLRDVADAAQVSMPYLSEVERGRKEASSEVLAAICRALGIRLVDLLVVVMGELVRYEPLPAQPARPVGFVSSSYSPSSSFSAGFGVSAVRSVGGLVGQAGQVGVAGPHEIVSGGFSGPHVVLGRHLARRALARHRYPLSPRPGLQRRPAVRPGAAGLAVPPASGGSGHPGFGSRSAVAWHAVVAR